MNPEADTTQNTPNEVSEVVEVQGNKLLQTVKDILAAGQINRLIISSVNGNTLLDVPYGAGLTVAALVTLLIPPLAVLTPIGLLLGRFRIEVIRPDAK